MWCSLPRLLVGNKKFDSRDNILLFTLLLEPSYSRAAFSHFFGRPHRWMFPCTRVGTRVLLRCTVLYSTVEENRSRYVMQA